MSDLFAGARITPEHHPAMLALTQYLAERLGPGWTSEDGILHMAVHGPGGQHLVLHRLAGPHTGRIGIRGVLPDGSTNTNRPDPHTITVAATRPAAAIAAEIERRLLPAYAPAAAAADREQRRRVAATAARLARAAALAHRLGGTVREWDDYTTYVDLAGDNGQAGTLRLQGDGATVTADLEGLSADALLAVGTTAPTPILEA